MESGEVARRTKRKLRAKRSVTAHTPEAVIAPAVASAGPPNGANLRYVWRPPARPGARGAQQ